MTDGQSHPITPPTPPGTEPVAHRAAQVQANDYDSFAEAYTAENENNLVNA